MDIFNQLINQFSQISYVKEWNELQTLFQKVASSKPKHWLLPLYACEAVGGNTNQAMPAILAAGCSHISIVLVDDMLDEDERGEYRKLGEPAVANMAVALQSAALHVIQRSAGLLGEPENLNQTCGTVEMSQNAKLLAIETVNEMFFATTIGQYWDVNSIVKDEEDYWKIAKAKSSPFFGTSFQLGALMGGATLETSLQIKELGSMYGEMIQIHDDVDDALSQPAKPDWEAKNKCLPILFASIVDHPQKNQFEQMRPNARTNLKSLEEAQEILIQCGAISYCMYQLLERDKIVKEKIAKIKIERRDVLEKIFDDIVLPVHQLFKEIDSLGTAVGAG